MRRRRLVVVLVAVAGVGGVALVRHAATDARPLPRAVAPEPEVTVRTDGGASISLRSATLMRDGAVQPDIVRAVLRRRLPPTLSRRRGRARITYRYDVDATAGRVLSKAAAGGSVVAAVRPVSAVVAAPVLQQAQRNTCESAALEVLMATVGKRVDQGRLQAAFPRSGPLDPEGTMPDATWGDPDKGYVGRPDGGGNAGGFGIYPGPVRATAARFGVRLQDISGASPSVVYDRLLAGRAVMVWVGLSDGPFGRWRAPDGSPVRVNFGEHTVVLHGLRSDGQLVVSNPLEGTRELWSKAKFQAMWQLLGRRALAA